MTMTKEIIIEHCVDPITIKDLHKKTGIKWANLSRHISRLKQKGWIIDVGRDGKSKVIQLNKFKYNDHLKRKIREIENQMERFM